MSVTELVYVAIRAIHPLKRERCNVGYCLSAQCHTTWCFLLTATLATSRADCPCDAHRIC
eukprot:1635520-Rhodomonas_salina.1